MYQDFNKGKIYKITNDYNDDIYIGSTCDTLIRRFINHKSDSKKEHCKNKPIYKLMNEIGFERFRIELIEEYTCQDKYQLRQREGHFIREIGTLNQNIAGRTKQEYQKENYEANREHLEEYKKNNKEKYQKINKDYYQKNQEYITERVLCECGCSISRSNIAKHNKTIKHIAFQK